MAIACCPIYDTTKRFGNKCFAPLQNRTSVFAVSNFQLRENSASFEPTFLLQRGAAQMIRILVESAPLITGEFAARFYFQTLERLCRNDVVLRLLASVHMGAILLREGTADHTTQRIEAVSTPQHRQPLCGSAT